MRYRSWRKKLKKLLACDETERERKSVIILNYSYRSLPLWYTIKSLLNSGTVQLKRTIGLDSIEYPAGYLKRGVKFLRASFM